VNAESELMKRRSEEPDGKNRRLNIADMNTNRHIKIPLTTFSLENPHTPSWVLMIIL
jgi:hypothetical protein